MLTRNGSQFNTCITVRAPNFQVAQDLSATEAKKLWGTWGALEQTEIEKVLAVMPTNVFVRRKDRVTHMVSGAIKVGEKEVRVSLRRIQKVERDLFKVTASFRDLTSGKTRRHKATVTIPRELNELVIPATAVPRGLN